MSHTLGEIAQRFGLELKGDAGTVISGTLGPAPIQPNSVRLEIDCGPITALPAGRWYATGAAPAYVMVVTDDGAGNLVDDVGANVGTINYTTGDWSVETTSTQTVTVQSNNAWA